MYLSSKKFRECLCGCIGLTYIINDLKGSLQRCSKIAKQPTGKPDVLVTAVEKLKDATLPDLAPPEKVRPNGYTLLVKAISNTNKAQEFFQTSKKEDLKGGIIIIKSVGGEKISVRCGSEGLKRGEKSGEKSATNINLTRKATDCRYFNQYSCNSQVLKIVYKLKVSQ